MTAPAVPTDSLASRTLDAVVATLTSLILPDDGPTATLRVHLPIVQVMPDHKRWHVLWLTHEGSSVRGTFCTKHDALAIARQHAEQLTGTLAIHRLDGSLQQTYHYGPSAPGHEAHAP